MIIGVCGVCFGNSASQGKHFYFFLCWQKESTSSWRPFNRDVLLSAYPSHALNSYHLLLFFLSSLTFSFSSLNTKDCVLFIYHVMLSTGTLGIQTYLAIWCLNLENLNIFNTCKCLLSGLLLTAMDASLLSWSCLLKVIVFASYCFFVSLAMCLLIIFLHISMCKQQSHN